MICKFDTAAFRKDVLRRIEETGISHRRLSYEAGISTGVLNRLLVQPTIEMKAIQNIYGLCSVLGLYPNGYISMREAPRRGKNNGR